ncbi:phosphonate C-P lyase system protein PhnG [Synechococcus sp. PCC 7335]|uniref:phosphonate C-P lyase system protein PhnG n=1 Tax=Synechococcus sp. (strain ATCC 29403 / PCC 7335) TaxID=91464 RepID=UPI00017EE7F4|nr:phosphonate C-P lyase system protein PhnG [Synechococcus sp. PCC 7335]EDX87270.1 phosphonate C-P lyase system protein PhnG [Synechococcus sp. PCC 7335]
MTMNRADRQAWMAVLAKAPLDLLEQCVRNLGDLPKYRFLRSPEVGLTMVRGRAGGGGEAFNLGEMTVTRCVVQLTTSVGTKSDEESSGFGYVAGRSQIHAELAAVCDALLQQHRWHYQIKSTVIAPLQAAYQRHSRETQQQTAATQVEFFTLLRGE